MIHTTIVWITHDVSDEDFCVVNTDYEASAWLKAHAWFFKVNPDDLHGKSVLIVADSRQNIIRIFDSNEWEVYTHNEPDYEWYSNITDANRKAIADMFADSQLTKESKKRVSAQRRSAKSHAKQREKFEADPKQQSKYENMKYSMEPEIRSIFGMEKMADYYTFAQMVNIALGYSYMMIIKEIGAEFHLTGYIGKRQYQKISHIEEIFERYYRTYIQVAKYAEYPMDLHKYINELEKLIVTGKYDE